MRLEDALEHDKQRNNERNTKQKKQKTIFQWKNDARQKEPQENGRFFNTPNWSTLDKRRQEYKPAISVLGNNNLPKTADGENEQWKH